MEIVLFQPQIPPNTGSIARLCAATDTPLHLIEPLGFSLDDRYLKRAGLDYWPHVKVRVWPDWQAFLDGAQPSRLVATSARFGVPHHEFAFSSGDTLVLGPEATGLPMRIIDSIPLLVRVPIWGQVRSLNLANAAGILLYEAYRQTGALQGR